MEPVDYPYNDPGPNTLLVGLDDAENLHRLRRAMTRAEGYVGIMPGMGGKFLTAEQKLAPVLDAVHREGVIIFDPTMDNRSQIAPLSRLGRIPFSRADMSLDASHAHQMAGRLASIEKMAAERGRAVVVVRPYPALFPVLKKWLAELQEKDFVLAPVTATLSESASSNP